MYNMYIIYMCVFKNSSQHQLIKDEKYRTHSEILLHNMEISESEHLLS